MKNKVPDINNLTREQVENFALMNKIIVARHSDIIPEKRRKRKMFDFAATLTGYYDKTDEEQAALFARGADPDVLFEFLRECEQKDNEQRENELRDKLKTLDDIPLEKKRFLNMLSSRYSDTVYLKSDEGGVRIILSCHSYVVIYRLLCNKKSRSFTRSIRFDDYCVPVIYDKQSGLYSLSFWFTDDDTKPKTISFSDFEVEEVSVNAIASVPYDHRVYTAYRFLSVASEYIILKSKSLSADFLCEKEKVLLPLLEELCDVFTTEYKKDGYPEFGKILFNNNAKKPLSLLGKVKGEGKKRTKAAKRLLYCLCDAKYEPVWRDIYGKIYDSQKDYPSWDDIIFPKKKYDALKLRLDNKMHSLGYSGEYPCYTKKGTVKGIRPIYKSAESKLAFPVKTASFFVSCYTFLDDDGELYPQLYAGFAVNADNIAGSDVFSCQFCGSGAVIEMTDNEEYTLELAAKTAECKKLSRKEKSRVYSKKNIRQIILFCLLYGLLFGLLFTAVSIPLFYLLTLLDGETSTFSDFIKSFPLLFIFLFSWLGFSSCMTAFIFISRKRRI